MFRRTGNDAEILAPKRTVVSGSSTSAGKPHMKASVHSRHVSLLSGPHYLDLATPSRAWSQAIARFRSNQCWSEHLPQFRIQTPDFTALKGKVGDVPSHQLQYLLVAQHSG